MSTRPAAGRRLSLVLTGAILALAWAALLAAGARAEPVIANGDFAAGLSGWSVVDVAEGSFPGYPHIAAEVGSGCQPHLSDVKLDVPGGADGYVEQTIKVPAAGGRLTFLEWGALEATNVTISAVVESTPKILDQSSPPPTQAGSEGEFCSGTGAAERSADLSAYAGKEIGLRVEATASGFNGTIAYLTNFSVAPAEGLIEGKVIDQLKRPAAGAKVTVKGTSDEEKQLEATATANAKGEYAIAVAPGKYTLSPGGEPTDQNGGAYSFAKGACPGAVKESSCELGHIEAGETQTVNYTYTQCAAKQRMTNGKEPTGCPVIFVPGILGSRIFCNQGELFLSLSAGGGYFGLMQLEPDGETNHGIRGSCNATAYVPKGEEGLLQSVGPEDVYGGVFKYLQSIAKNGVYAYPYDWRRGVPIASHGLGEVVDEILAQTGAEHVVLVAHSMGGLVSEQYIVESSGAKVSRALTIGTPYLGAPKSLISMMNGLSNEFAAETADKLFDAKELQLAVRNYTGLFWLYPSAPFGPWLRVFGAKGVPNRELGGDEVGSWVSALKGNAALLSRAAAGHATLDGFKPGEVDYQIIVGTGVPTIVKMKLAVNEFEPEQWVSATYASGDGTVPAASQTQGAFPANQSGPVRIHYIAGVKHSDEPGSAQVKGRIEAFVQSGGEIGGPEEAQTSIAGAEVIAYKTNLIALGQAARVRTAGSELSLAQAVSRGLVQYLQLGGRTVIVTNAREPVKLELHAPGLSLRISPIEANGSLGRPSYYGPVNGPVVISGTLASQGTHRLRPASTGAAPRAIARVTRRGRRFLVRLLLAHGSGTIRYRIGAAKPRLYTRPLRLTRAQLARLRFAAVSSFGVWESPQRAHARG